MKADRNDAAPIARILRQMWHSPEEELLGTVLEYIGSDQSAVFEHKEDGKVVGAALCSLRHDYVEGCDSSPVGYLEGVCVDRAYRGAGIARRLLAECEQWARDMGCSEFASDCELDNTGSLAFHLAAGFTEENRIICFKKNL